MQDNIPIIRRQLQQIKELHDSAAIGASQYEESKRALERKLVDLVLSGESTIAAPKAPSPARTLMVVLGGVLALVAAAGYWWLGSFSQVGITPSSPHSTQTSPEIAPASPHAMSVEQIANMAEQLAERLKEHPDDAEGWAMLARSYTVLGRHSEATPAYAKAVALRADDAELLTDYADALAVQNNRQLDGEPMKLIARALELQPTHLKALSLAGTAAFDRKDYATAVKHWEKIVAVGPPDSAQVQQAQASLAEARELGKITK